MSLLLPVQPPLGTATFSLLRVPRPQTTLPTQRQSCEGPQGCPVQSWGLGFCGEGKPGFCQQGAPESQTLWPLQGFSGQMATWSTHPPLRSLQAQSDRCCCPCESHLGTRRPCFRPPDAQMPLLQGGGWEEKQVVEGEGGGTRKREGQRVGEGPVGHSVQGTALWGWGVGRGLYQNPHPGKGWPEGGKGAGWENRQLRTHQ